MSKISESELTDLILEAGLLKKIVRTGWALKGVVNPESVAEHTWRVAVLAMVLAPQLGVDREKLTKMALVHDLGEAAIGDIKWESGKRVIGSREEKHRDERKAMREMFSDNPSFGEYVELWEEFEKQETDEARIVKQLDKLEMVVQALEYEREGYPSEKFDEFWENAGKYLEGKELEGYFRYLQEQRGE